jgi:hypothetical protein
LLGGSILAAIFTSLSPVVFWYSRKARLSLIVTSTRPCLSSVMAWVKPSTGSTCAPASVATSANELVVDCALRLPLTSASDLTLSSSARVTTTPFETVYGSENRYFFSRSGVIVTWLAMTSYRSASSPAKIASNCVSLNSTSMPSSAPTAWATSTS